MTRCRRTKAVRKWVAVTSHPFFGSGFCWPESSSLPLIAHADDGTCIHTRTTRAHLLLIWKFERNTVKPRLSSPEFSRRGIFFLCSLSLPLSSFFLPFFRVLRAVAVRKSLFFRTDGEHAAWRSLRTFRRGTMKRHCVSDKGFKELYDRVLTRRGLFMYHESLNLTAPGYVNRENEIIFSRNSKNSCSKFVQRFRRKIIDRRLNDVSRSRFGITKLNEQLTNDKEDKSAIEDRVKCRVRVIGERN